MPRPFRWSVIAAALAGTACLPADVASIRDADLLEAGSAVESNLAAIRRRDTEAYLAHYLNAPEFTVAASDSIRRGFVFFAEARRASGEWPDTLQTESPTLVWLGPGVVWAGFRYRAVLGGEVTRGVSERVLVKTTEGWKIKVTGSMEE
jgi:hypothetical protein